MIYALINQHHPDADCLAIAQAIPEVDHDAIAVHVANGSIVHIMNAGPDDQLYCIYCRDSVTVSSLPRIWEWLRNMLLTAAYSVNPAYPVLILFVMMPFIQLAICSHPMADDFR